MITLYVKPHCPYSRKVLRAVEELGVEATIKEISEEANLDELLHLGGVRQVPFLVDDENDFSTYESDAIVEYLCKKFTGDSSRFKDTTTHICDL
ncbi:MAG: glutathione S-transferase family protein [Patescibacteria group bacterium UBA2163]